MVKPLSRVSLTAGRVESFTCPPGKSQAFLWDTTVPSLALRVTPTGRKTYVFEARLAGATVRINIGSAAEWQIKKAQVEAQRLKMLVDSNQDPREIARLHEAEKVAKATIAAAQTMSVGDVWAVYVAERRPHWGDLHYRDHVDKAKPGGLPSGRRGGGKMLTKPGPLAELMPIALKDLTSERMEQWAAKEGKARASSARNAWRLFTVFLNWCAEQPAYAGLLPAKNPAKSKKAREFLGKAGVKKDVLQREQLNAWFGAVEKIPNRTISTCLQVLLLTGARLNEILAMRWEDVNTQWKGIAIHDKVEGEREIPATPYVLQLLSALPRTNEWVFASARYVKDIYGGPGHWVNTSATGRLTEPNTPHTRACRAAGLEGLTLHGLRRSFKSLTEWLEVPAGVVAQVMGHKPSATAEKHYTVRPLELLRLHHEKIEAWILEQAGIVFDAKAAPGTLRAVQAA